MSAAGRLLGIHRQKSWCLLRWQKLMISVGERRVIARFFVFVHERGLILSVDTPTHLFLRWEGEYSRLNPARGARHKEIAAHRVRSFQAPQMPSVHTQEGCRVCCIVLVRLFVHFQCSDSGLAMQLTCISVLKNSSINRQEDLQATLCL